MRTVVIAIGLVVLLAVGWIINGLTSDREKEELAVHYSWIVKWALTLSRESGKAPDRATFDSPRIQVAGDSHRWLVTGRMSWRCSRPLPTRSEEPLRTRGCTSRCGARRCRSKHFHKCRRR